MEKVERILARGMSVADLIAELQSMPQDAKVGFVVDYGDYCHTQQFLPVKTVREPENEELVPSGYSQSGAAIREFDEDPDQDPETVAPVVPFVILSMSHH